MSVMTLEELRSIADEFYWIEGKISIPLSQFVHNNCEEILDIMGETLVEGGSIMSSIQYVVIGHTENTLHLLLRADASALLNPEDDYDYQCSDD